MTRVLAYFLLNELGSQSRKYPLRALFRKGKAWAIYIILKLFLVKATNYLKYVS